MKKAYKRRVPKPSGLCNFKNCRYKPFEDAEYCFRHTPKQPKKGFLAKILGR